MRLIQSIGALLLLSLISLSVSAQANAADDDEEFLPLAKAHLQGRRLDALVLETATAPATNAEQAQTVDLKSVISSELQRSHADTFPQNAKSGSIHTFKDTISNVRIEGKFEIMAVYASITDNYLRMIEANIKSNIFPPIIARAMQQTSSVSVIFMVRKDGTITQIEKEASTGSAALDSTAISACRSSSPLPAPPAVNVDDVVRIRFVLTFNP
jgi:TonB family protein